MSLAHDNYELLLYNASMYMILPSTQVIYDCDVYVITEYRHVC